MNFLRAYGKEGLKIWAISPGNEPVDLGKYSPYKNTMSWSPKSVARWIVNNLGPSIAASSSNDTVILVGDDLRNIVPDYVTEIFQNLEAADYVAGIAIHANLNNLSSPQLLDRLNNDYPNKFLIITENSVGECLEEWIFKSFPSVRPKWMINREFPNKNHSAIYQVICLGTFRKLAKAIGVEGKRTFWA